MNQLHIHTFTHANLNTPVEVLLSQLFTYYYSESHKSTLLLAIGGAMIPVKEGVDEVRKALQGLRRETVSAESPAILQNTSKPQSP
jgi:hypothetical protein